MAFNDEYSIILRKIISIRCSHAVLETLKETFAESINSKREKDFIGNLNDLIKVLEKRFCLHREDISSLRTIGNILERTDIINMISNYGHVRCIETNVPEPIFPPVHSDCNIRVYEEISRKIGKEWKDFARGLRGVTEYQIDELGSRYTIRDIIRKVLDYHEQNCEPNRLRTSICNALSEARRNDLRHEVENIFDSHHLIHRH